MKLTARQALALFATVAAFAVAYFYFKPEPAPTGVHLPAMPAAAVAREETVPLQVDFVKVFAPGVKKKLKLPASVQQDAGKHVIAATKTPADERSHTVTSVLDVSTGEVSSYDRAEPLPWVAVSTKSEVGAFYGIKDGEPTVRIQGQQELLRIKALRMGAVATADVRRGDVDMFVGVGVWARW